MKKTPKLAITLLASLCGLLALSGHARQLDPEDPRDAIKIRQKFICSLNEAEPTISWWKGSMYSRREGEKDRELFKLVGINVRQCTNLQDEIRGPGFRSVSREVMLYLDPTSGEVLNTWENPWTGETVDVVHVANDPVNMRAPWFAYSNEGKGVEFNGTVMNGRVMTNGNVPLFYQNPLGGDYQEYIGGTYHAIEMFNDYAYEEDVFDSEVKKLDRLTFSWTRVSDWLPWMKMGSRGGIVFTTTIGRRLASLEDIPEPLLSELKTNYQRFLSPPPVDDKRPNMTSWMSVKAKLDKESEDNGSHGGHQ